MRYKKVYSIIIAALLSGLAITAVPTMAGDYNSVYGYLYINDEIAPSGVIVKLIFTDTPEEITDETDSNGHYQIDFTGHNWEEGFFFVYSDGDWQVPIDNQSVEILPYEIGYEYDLHIDISNNPPNAPSNPNPSNGATNVDNNKVLSWSCSDPDGDPLTFDVYFGGSTSPPLVSSGQTGKSYNPPGAMDYSGTYYWKIIAHDDKGASTSGPEWSFTVESSEPSPTPPSNLKPNAVAIVDEPVGFVDQEITFDGTDSSDPDGTIENYTWDFGDGTKGYGSTPTHIYDSPGEYTVNLTVTDDDGATDTDTTSVFIAAPNIPPEAPVISGPNIGTKNESYDYTFVSIDDDNDTLSYNISWGDENSTTTDFYPNATEAPASHSFGMAGIYTISANAFDNKTASGSTNLVVLIDAWWVKEIGYIIDYDANGVYEKFYSNSTEEETDTGKDNGKYLIDEDGDGKWDWVYDKETDTLTPYTEEEEDDYTLWYVLIILLLIIILIIIGYLASRKKKKTEPKKPEQKKPTNKNPTSKKK